jgi:molecular chaperone GrpE
MRMSKQEKEKLLSEEEKSAEITELDAAEDVEEAVTTETDESAAAPTEIEDEKAADEMEVSEEETAAAAPTELEAELEEVRQEAAKNLENWQRAAAELANYKRRQEEQRKFQRDRIKSEVLEGVVSALDDMDLAFQNLPEELDGQLVGWVEGFRLVQRKLDKILDEQNVMIITTNGKFDPNFHEAVSYEDSEAHEEGDIIGELRKGYQIGNRIIRPALVRVAK